MGAPAAPHRHNSTTTVQHTMIARKITTTATIALSNYYYHKYFFFLFFCITLNSMIPFSWAAAAPESDSLTLIKFKNSLENNTALTSWNQSSKPCDGDRTIWDGVLCDDGFVWGLNLQNIGLTGKIDLEILKELPELRALGFMTNNFDGPFPNIKQLGMLKSIYLSNNQFSGEIPSDAFSNMGSLKKVHLAQNKFTGKIPSSLVELSKLVELRLEDNQFSGQIPNFNQTRFTSFNVSNNMLEGEVPERLSVMDPTSFSGNEGLCGKPLTVPCSNTTQQNSGGSTTFTNSNSAGKSSSTLLKVVIPIVIVVILVIVSAIIFFLYRRRNRASSSIEAPSHNVERAVSIKESNPEKLASSEESSPNQIGNGSGGKADNLKLSFVRDDREKFEIQDLLRASAEVLGSGSFGSSYKTVLFNGQAVMVVKRFKHMNNVGKEEFHEHMRRIGRLRHPNVLPLVAYYYKREEKLLVADFVSNGSLAVQLHGHRAVGQPRLDWPTRLKIVQGVANGLKYLFTELPSLTVPHGHLKSSNVLLNETFEPLLTDYGLIPVTNHEQAHDLMVAYKSPEYIQQGRVTKKTDAWNFGVLILEILTGKFPTFFIQQGKGMSSGEDLARWVHLVPEEEWLDNVIDPEIVEEIKKNSTYQREIFEILNIGLACCEENVQKRMDIKEAVETIEELKERLEMTTTPDHED